MFGSAILDTMIGMAFVILVLSLVCGIIQEIIAAVLAWRAKTLKTGIRQLLNDGELTRLYSHALIKPLMKAGGDPSYIPSRTFALAVLDLMDPTGAQKGAATAQAFAAALPDGTLKNIAQALVGDATMKLEDLRKNLEDWFDDAMDRVSGWYKRRAQIVTMIVGLVVCVCFNVDAIAVFSTLWKDPTVRESAVQQAARFNANTEDRDSLSVEALSEQLQTLALPIGWTIDPDGAISFGRFRPESIIGWIIGALAVSMGAQFWFDMLGKLLNLRSAGTKPPTAAERRS